MADRINDDTHSSDDNKIERGCSSWYGALHWGHMITVPGRSWLCCRIQDNKH